MPSDYRFSFCLEIFLNWCETPFALGRVERPSKFLKNESFIGFQCLEWVSTKEGVTFFRVVAVFTKI